MVESMISLLMQIIKLGTALHGLQDIEDSLDKLESSQSTIITVPVLLNFCLILAL